MQTFRYLIGVSVGTAIALSGGGGSFVALANTEPATTVPEVTRKTSPPPGTAVPVSQQINSPSTRPELYLDPDANPLQSPTQPSEVRIEGTQPLTLEQAVDLAQRNNRALQRTQLELEQARAQLREVQADRLPQLRLQTDITRQRSASGEIQAGNQPDIEGQANPDLPQTTVSADLELSYNLYTSGRRVANIRAAESLVRIRQLEVERLAEQTRLDIAQTYYQVQQSTESLRIRQQAVINAGRSLRDAQALEQAGVGTRFAVLQAQVQLANEEQRLAEAIAQLRTDRRTLARQLSLPEFVDVTAADPVAIAGQWQIPLEDSIVLAYNNRAELSQQLLVREQRQQQRLAELSQLGPQVTLFARYSLLGVAADDPLTADGSGDGTTLGARLLWNLFDGGEAKARADQRAADQAIAETQFADNQNQVRLEVERAYFDLTSSYENIQTSEQALEQATESLRLARLRFQAGVGTQTEVIDAETRLTEAEFNRVQAVLGYNLALARLRRAVSNIPSPPATP